MNCMHCMLCVVRDVERVVEKLYGSIAEPLILIGHRFVHSFTFVFNMTDLMTIFDVSDEQFLQKCITDF